MTVSSGCLHQRFIKTAKRRFSALAMADSTGRELSFGETLAGAMVLAREFEAEFAGQAHLCMLLPTACGGALANVAALMAGKTPVNLNFTAGPGAVVHAVDKTSSRGVLASRAFVKKAGLEGLVKGLQGNGSRVVYMEDLARRAGRVRRVLAYLKARLLPAGVLARLYRAGADPGRPASVVFTSGSTGTPKGVVLTHGNILSNVDSTARVLATGSGDVMVGVLPLFHAFGLTATLWFPLIRGFASAYHPNPLDARGVGELVKKRRGTIIIGTPTFFSAYARKCAPGDFSSIRLAVAGAEKLRDEVYQCFLEKFGVELLEGYGATELSPVVSVNAPGPGRRRGTVGRALPGVSVRVVDADTFAPAGPGSEGLIMVKGPNLMAGYLGEPEATARVVRGGWYVTGDIGRVSPDGFITITDRLSRFTKLAGEMVPHSAVEGGISSLDGVEECVVVSVPDPRKGEKLVAFYTGTAGPEELRKGLLGTKMPRLWVPGRFERVDEVPRTGTGKADLGRLKALARGQPGTGA